VSANHQISKRAPALLSTLVALLSAAHSYSEEELPKRTPGERFDFEPDLMLDIGATAPLPDRPSPADQVAKLLGELERATRSAAAGERLFRSGVIAKVDAEQRALKVIRLKWNLADARLLVAQAEAEQLRANGGANRPSSEEVAHAEAALEAARAAAEKAAQEWRQAELAAAELDLDRQRKLVAAGIGSKARVQRASERVARLKAEYVATPPNSP